NIGCTFCASGLLTKSRDLTSGEIVEQIMNVQKHLDSRDKEERVSHIVVMGIGEPFDNYNNLIAFLRVVNDNKVYQLVRVISLFQRVDLHIKYMNLLI